jgi:hypothetical protein
MATAMLAQEKLSFFNYLGEFVPAAKEITALSEQCIYIWYKYKESMNFHYVKGQCFYQLFFPCLHKDNRNKGPKTKTPYIPQRIRNS